MQLFPPGWMQTGGGCGLQGFQNPTREVRTLFFTE